MKFDYSVDEEPAVAFIPLRIGHDLYPDRAGDFRAKIDTGSDMTAVPETAATFFDLRKAGELVAEGFDGRQRKLAVYAARLELPSGERVRLNVLTIPADYVLLGRDVLNLPRLLLDGPALTLEILPST